MTKGMKWTVALGLLLSLSWSIGASFYMLGKAHDEADKTANLGYSVCLERVRQDLSKDDCDKERERNRAQYLEFATDQMLVVAILPLPFAWLASISLFAIVRALLIGLRASLSWKEMTWPTRVLVLSCAMFCSLSLLVAVLALSVLVLSTRVPVSPGESLLVIQYSPGEVEVSGSWQDEEEPKAEWMRQPIQSSKIRCSRNSGICTEAKATVYISDDGFKSLFVSTEQYEISSWTDSQIAYADDGLCRQARFTIDLVTKAVTGAEVPIEPAPKQCEELTARPSLKRKRMVDGIDVYFEEQRRARPWPLRIVGALFGG